jgi:dihydrofolate reductase
MPRVQYYVAASIDGYIAEEDGGLQWLFDAAEDPITGDDPNYRDFYAGVTAIAVGASTYDIMLGHEWAYGAMPTWVFTHRTFDTPAGADVRYVQGSVEDHLDDMRAAAGDGVLWVLGGGELASQFVEAGALDDVIVTYVPAVLGTGIPLFARPIGGQLELTSTEELTRGAVQNIYALKKPSR